MGKTEFRAELEHIINRSSMENGSNTPDFILAEYLADCLAAFDKAVNRRAEWYGRMDRPGGGSTEVSGGSGPDPVAPTER